MAIALLPLLVALPAAVARCWATPAARRQGVVAVAVVVALLATIALTLQLAQGSGRAAQPLGHHLLLAGVLATLLPPVLGSALAERGPLARATLWTAVALAGAALLASRSVAGLVAALLGAAVVPRGRQRAWLLAGALGAALVLAPRLLAGGADASLAARVVYWWGGLRGGAERPLLGWGPGATAWTLAPHVRPRPGVVPPGEVVGDLHSLPVQLWYELGAAGLLAVALLATLFVGRRWRGGAIAGQIGRGALGGMLAAGLHLTTSPTLGTTAPWVALALAAGAALAAESPGSAVGGGAASAVRGSGLAGRAGALYAALALLLLLPLDLAHLAYDAARGAPVATARELLARAAALDPQQPLYRARLGWLEELPAARLRALREAALGAPGVAALQLAAGVAAREADESGRSELRRACAADPLDGVAPLLLAFESSPAEAAPLAARAQLAMPLLTAAVEWERRRPLWHASRRLLWDWPGVDSGYLRQLVERTRDLPRRGPTGSLRLMMDAEPATATSLIVFRRLPWPAPLVEVELRQAAARVAATLPRGAELSSTAPAAFPAACRPPALVRRGESAAAAEKAVEK
jgi:hypothetical protein